MYNVGEQTIERQKLSEVAAQAQIDVVRRVIAAERRKETELSTLDRQYQQEIERGKTKYCRTLTQLDTVRRLYIGIRPTPSRCNRLSATPPTASVDHDSTHAELSAASAQFLVQLAFEADQIVRQLTAQNGRVGGAGGI